MDRKIKPPDLSSQRAQQSAQGELVSGTSGIGIIRLPPTTSQQDQSAKKKPKKSNNENEGDVSTIPQESDESVQYSMDRRGILRGKCLLEECDCSQYELPADSKTQLCSYCGDPPAKHLIVQTAESEKDDKEHEAQQSAQGEPVSGTSGLGPSTSQQDQSAKEKPKKSNNENVGNVSTMLQESDESDEAEALSKEENNFLRFDYTCRKIATQAVRPIFDSKVPGHTLESFLKQHRLSLTSPRSRYRCTKEQELILFPDGQVVVSTDFDFTLLYKLIRNLLTAIPAPTCGWGNEPLPGHLNETDDIERIRYLRNFCAHNTEFKICDADFSTHWTDLSQVIDRLSKGSLSTDVDSMRTKSFDKCIKNEMEEDIRKEQEQMRKDFIEIQKQVADNKRDIADNKQNTADNKQNIAEMKQNIADNKQEIHNINTRHTQNEAEALSKEGNNFFRLYLLTQKIATQAVRVFFDSKVLDSFLKQHRSSPTSRSNHYISLKNHEAVLFPGGQLVVTSADFDISLLYKLIRFFLTDIPPPTCGWGKQPLPGYLSETDDIERIRHARNNFVHRPCNKICDADFFTHWTDLSQAINRLSKGSFSTDVESLRTTNFIENEAEAIMLKELFTDEAEAIMSKEEINFFRLYHLCLYIAPQAVRVFFDSKVLDSFLKQHRSSLTSRSNHYRCTKDQEAILFPGGQVVVASADFDFTLLYKLIRNFLTDIPPPTCGWGNQPLPGYLNETDDIERIRHSRNDFVHNPDHEICDANFFTHWTDLSQVINRLSKGSLSRDVESMRMKKFDRCTKNEMEEDIQKELKKIREEEFMELNQKVTENSTDIAVHRQKINKINDRHIPLNIRKVHIELIKEWRLEDKPFYDKTGGFSAALKLVQSGNYMTIIGGPGSGKTATARHIALQLEEQGWEVVPVYKLEDIMQYGERDHKQVFVLDNVLGIFVVDMNVYDHCIKYEEQIFKSIGGASKLIFTCRKSVHKEALKFGLFVTENVVDLQSKDNQLTEKEKTAICQYHCEAKGVNSDLYTSFSFTKANHMFPLLCKLFSMEEKYQRLKENFFNKPLKFVNRELKKLLDRNTIQYAVLVLCLVNKGRLSVEHLPRERMQEVFNNCGVNLSTPDKQIKDAIYHMSETYFTKLDTEYTFMHDFIFEAIAYHYGSQSQNQQQILKYLSSSYIANKVTVYEQASNEDLCIHISEDMYLPLAERLYTDIQSTNLFDVFMNKSLKHGPFLDVFEGMLEKKTFDEFESLILRKHENIDNFVEKTLSVNKPIKKLSDITEHSRLNLLFDVVYREESDAEHSVRVISWIINYGHTRLLQEIVNHVERNNHSISLIFGSNVMENTRLLLLGCFSNTLDMVELILKYVNPKCIDMECGESSCIKRNFHRCYTPLTATCETGNLCIVKALMNNNAVVNKCNYMNESPLFVAIKHGHVDVARCLLSSDANTNVRDVFGKSPLSIASEEGKYDIVKDLVAHKAAVNLTDNNNRSPLYLAAKMGHYDIVHFLLQSGAYVDISDLDESPMNVASSSGHYNIVRLLNEHGVLSAGNAKSRSKSISKRTNGNEILADSIALLNPCGYPEEKISHSKEKQKEEREAICLPKVQEGKEETTFTREQEEKEEIIYTRRQKKKIKKQLTEEKSK